MIFNKNKYISFIDIYLSIKRKYFSKKIRSGINNNCTMFMIVKNITCSNESRIIIDFANNLALKNINITILCRSVDTYIPFNKNINVIESRFFYCFNIIYRIKKFSSAVACVFDENTLSIMKYIKYFVKVKIIYFATRAPKINKRFRKNIKNVDFVYSISEDISVFFIEKFLIRTRNIRQFNIPVDTDVFDVKKISHERIKKIVKTIGLDKCEKKILFYECNNLKCIDTIIQVINKIAKKRDDFIFIFEVEKSKMTEIFEKNYSNLNCIKFIDGIIDESAMLSVSYAVICSLMDNDYSCKNTIRKTEILGVPLIVLSKKDFLPDVIENKIGMYVNYDNVEDICLVIERILNLSELEYNKMCKNAISYAKKYFISYDIYKDVISDIKKLTKNT